LACDRHDREHTAPTVCAAGLSWVAACAAMTANWADE
jgi:hypothetical protein